MGSEFIARKSSAWANKSDTKAFLFGKRPFFTPNREDNTLNKKEFSQEIPPPNYIFPKLDFNVRKPAVQREEENSEEKEEQESNINLKSDTSQIAADDENKEEKVNLKADADSIPPYYIFPKLNFDVPQPAVQRQEALENEQEEDSQLNLKADEVIQAKYSDCENEAQQESESVQTKLTVGEPGDKYEQEADAVAAKVVEHINSPQTEQPVQGKVEPIVKPNLMRQGGAGRGTVNRDIEQSIQQARGGGQELAENVREPMEQAFGADFSPVKVHTDEQADVLNRSLNSRAFATGQDIFFKQGEYNPGSKQGQELLAHELTHVVQQTGTIQRQKTPPQPGQWNPPGKQPISFYIGNEAHLGIVAEYIANHLGDMVFTNFITISTILKAFQKMGLNPKVGNLSVRDLGLKPDILNASRRHLYEIKPESAQSQALNEARVYASIFAAAGITITLGPTNEPGTKGLIPAPGGFYVFWSPLPGVIVYKYGRQPQPVREPVKKPVKKPVKDPDFMKTMSEITGLTGIALIIYLILSEGSRLFPPRNLVPIP